MASMLEWRRAAGSLPRRMLRDLNANVAEPKSGIENRIELHIETCASSHDRLMRALVGGTRQFVVMSRDGRVAARVELRASGLTRTTHQIGGGAVTVDWSTAVVEYDTSRVSLSRTELRLLAALVDAKGASVSRLELIERVWPGDELPETARASALGVYVSSLRKCLAGVGLTSAILSKRGGYQLLQ